MQHGMREWHKSKVQLIRYAVVAKMQILMSELILSILKNSNNVARIKLLSRRGGADGKRILLYLC